MSESPEQFKARIDARYHRNGTFGPLPIIRVINKSGVTASYVDRQSAIAADMREAEIEWAYADRDDHAGMAARVELKLICGLPQWKC